MGNIHAGSGTPWIEDKFYSQITDDEIRFTVRLPETYEREPERRFSVHYFIVDTRAAASEQLVPALDRLVSSEQMAPILAVIIRRGDTDWNVHREGNGSEERHIILELIQYVDANYRSIPLRQGRSIHGVARGGREALRFAILYPLMFSAVLAYEPELDGNDLLQGVPPPNCRSFASYAC
ncbi:MAG: putative esterase [Paenibacillaceae bacterium]|jgi:enterochelin esterase-like enzyme|nr:putative esterase [Paenibacillaceae bacterium]